MQLMVLAVCALVVNAAFVAMFLANIKAVRARAPPEALRRSIAKELFWAAIPWLILVAAATPAVRSVLTAPKAVVSVSSFPRPPAQTAQGRSSHVRRPMGGAPVATATVAGATLMPLKAVPSPWHESGRPRGF